MTQLVAGANLALTGNRWTLTLRFPHDVRQEIGIAVLPVNDVAKLVSTPGFAHLSTVDWLTTAINAEGDAYTLTLDSARLPGQTISRLLVAVYRFSSRGGVSVAKKINLHVETLCDYSLDFLDMDAAAVLVAEVYQKSAGWKLRALAETSAYGLAVLANKMGMALDDSSPYPTSPAPAAEQWSGTAFLVAPGIFITNAHVIAGAQGVRLSSLLGNVMAELIIQDNNNDLALIRAEVSQQIQPLTFRQQGVGLAESVTTLGYPLAGLMGSGIQVTQGVVSGLFGAQNDIRLLQFTAPIQPGSSGSPLLDAYGAVVGVVSATFTQTQNMNFAIRGLLAVALLEAVNQPYSLQSEKLTLSTPQLVSQVQNAMWRVECYA